MAQIVKIFLKIFYRRKQTIASIMAELRIIDYTINPGGSIDVNGNVVIPNHMTEIPVQFGTVNGNFNCSHTKITSLKGSPREVGGDFWCSKTRIRSLRGGPREVGGDFWCWDTKITRLEGSPIEVGGEFTCYKTKITSLVGSPRKVYGDFWCWDTMITSLDGIGDVGGEVVSDLMQLPSLSSRLETM